MRRWAQIFAGLTVVLFAGTLCRMAYLDFQTNRMPCADLAATSATAMAAAPVPSVVNFSPKKINLGAPLCIAVAGAADVATDQNGKPTLHLFLDSLELKTAVGTLVDRKNNLLLFGVTRSTDDSQVWRQILSQPGWGSDGMSAGSVQLHVGVGPDSGEFPGTKSTPLELMVIDPMALALGFAAFASAVAALCCIATESGILRDGDSKSTYSLGRVQMAFWLYLITAAFIYIWLMTEDYNGILTSQALTLLGISGTTGVMAIAVNGSAAPSPSVGFWTDILSDSGGVALHRLQIVVWNAILGVVFFAQIYESLQLPTFDANLLILLGISGVTYVGFKFNEK